MKPPFEIDHIGIAVENIEAAFQFYKNLGYKDLKIEEVPSEKVRVGFIQFQNKVQIELLESTSPDGPIAKFIAKRGSGIHHICIKTPDIAKDLKNLKAGGVRLINEVAKPGAKGCMVAFVHPSSASGTLIELSEGGEHGV